MHLGCIFYVVLVDVCRWVLVHYSEGPLERGREGFILRGEKNAEKRKFHQILKLGGPRQISYW